MATTDTRSSFRLPWSSDRAQDAGETQPETDGDASTGPVPAEPAAWPHSDLTTRPEVDATAVAAPTGAQEPAMIDLRPTSQQAPPAPRKPSKLMTDLALAIRSTAESASEQALAQVDTDLAGVVEAIRSHSKDGEDALRLRSDEDVAEIKEWSRAEIARIKQETEAKIDARKTALDEELAAHVGAIEQRVRDVEVSADAFRTKMTAYAERLAHEDDPARLATMAESMPDGPQLEAWSDFDNYPLDLPAATLAAEMLRAAAAEEAAAEADAALRAEAARAFEAEAARAAEATAEAEAAVVAEAEAAVVAEAEAAVVAEAEAAVVAEAEAAATEASAEAEAAGEPAEEAESASETDPVMGMVEAEAPVQETTRATNPWGDAESGWGGGKAPATTPVADGIAAEASAEFESGLLEADDEADPDAQAALAARMDALGLDGPHVDRPAALLPDQGDDTTDAESAVTRVVVSGLVSVASIASFKRHLGRIGGVQTVAVASGPDGEFVFNVTHQPDLSFRDALPTLPGFAARVTSAGDGTLQVTARDPESEA